MERGEKTEIVLEYIRNGIKSGKWDNSLLPKELELAEMLSVSRWSVRNAFAHLLAEGIIERKKRLGTKLNMENLRHTLIGAVLRSSGHFYEDVYRHLQQKVTAAGFRLQSVDVYGFDKPKMRKHIRRGISSLAYLNEDKMILDGYIFRAYPYVDELLKKSPVFFDFFDAARPAGATGVLIDYYEIGRIGGKYLLDCGCKHPMLLNISGATPKNRHIPEVYACHKDKRVFDGYYDVLKEYGLDPMLYIYDSSDTKNLYEIFSDRRSQPDGVFSALDINTMHILKIARECGYMPKYSLGCFDTPWSKGLGDFEFPSITVPAEECASALLEQVLTPKELRKDIYIKPYLKG
ncbi:MAG: GntR family transcriptional regulator [Lentisphaeria bacterium]|nr:GntR family transcriptional regulator [Lentisphaeria bacterium]